VRRETKKHKPVAECSACSTFEERIEATELKKKRGLMDNVWWVLAGAALVLIVVLVRGLCHVSALADMEAEKWQREAANEKEVKNVR